ncbi:MAG: C4-type zinc ribbon domain-containing protein [Desulfurivibrio sp.]|nr:C4-type zinc ribbon domain-containing protein [Desulfurivibrio sp.]
MKEEINHLKNLQAIDLEISELETQLAKVADGLEQRRESITEHQAEAEKLRERLAELEARKKEVETGLEEDQARISDRQNKMMNIQTNREYQSLLKEAEEAKKSSKEREEELLKIDEELEEVGRRIEEHENLADGEEQLLAEDSAAADKKIAELNTAKEKIGKKRNTKSKHISAAVIKKYEMLRERRGGLAMAGVVEGVCRGCFMNIPPQLFNDLLKEDQLLICPTCNRIMYHQPPDEK